MAIKIGEKEYQIKEYATYWAVEYAEVKYSIKFTLSKKDFATIDEVKEFFNKKENVF